MTSLDNQEYDRIANRAMATQALIEAERSTSDFYKYATEAGFDVKERVEYVRDTLRDLAFELLDQVLAEVEARKEQNAEGSP